MVSIKTQLYLYALYLRSVNNYTSGSRYDRPAHDRRRCAVTIELKLRGRCLPPPRSIARCIIFIAAAIIFIRFADYT